MKNNAATQAINSKSTKWTIKPATNAKTLDALSVGFVPFELTTGQTATEFLASVATHGEKITAIKPANAIRAAFLAAKLANEYSGRIAARPSEIIASNAEIINATDAASAEYIDARNAYQRAKKHAEQDALLYSVSTDDKLRQRAENSARAVDTLKNEMDAARCILNDALAKEKTANAAIIAEYTEKRANAEKTANA